jgi:O-antigen/teichoic acid export membrane protein
MAMKARAARGVLWSLLEYGGGEAISFLVFLVLARLVTPADFGLVALAGVYVAFVQTFLVQGFADAVIQRAELNEDHCTTAFWANLAVAALFLLLGIALARPVAWLFGQPELAGIICWLSPVVLSTALNSIPQALFKRRLRFASFALRALVGIAAGGIVGVAMALNGWGVWSLVGQQLANGMVSVAVIWGTSEWRPGWRPARRSFAEMAPFSWNVIAGALVRFCYLKCDVFLIGLFLDARLLGYYTIVQRLLITCGLVTQSSVLPIVLPVLSRLQHDRQRFRDAFVTAVRLTQALWLPLAVGLGVVADPLIPLLFGRQWIPSIPLFEIMSLTGFFQLFSYFTAPALVALGKPEQVLRLGLAQFVAILVLFVPAAFAFGIMGVAAAFTAEFLVIIPFHAVALKRLAGVDLGEVIVQCRASIGAGAAMAVAVLLLKAELAVSLSGSALLAVLVAAGAVVYVAVFAVLGWRELREIAGFAESALGRRPAAAS